MAFPPLVPTHDPCPGREISYLGRVSCRPVDALTRAVLPAVAIGAAVGTMHYPGPQYVDPLYYGTLRGAAAGAMFGGALTAMAYANRAAGAPAAFAAAVVTVPLALYGALRVGAIPTA